MSSSLPFYIVQPQDIGMRLDKFLAIKHPEASRTRLQQLIENNYVNINGEKINDASFKIKAGQNIELFIPPIIEASPSPQPIPLDIVYEDEDVIVINKAAGMVVHPAPGHSTGTLVNALLNHCGESLSGINGIKRPGIVHRLDKETSGLLVAAKNDKAHHSLSHQLTTREMRRCYITLAWGILTPQASTIEGAIGRDPRHRQRMTLRENGKWARTHYKVIKFFGKLVSLIECRLETGRTHQIRVHLASQGHSLLGDPLYGKPPRALPSFLKEYLTDKWPTARHALHAKELSFIHPKTHEKLLFSVALPEDMRDLIDVLHSYYPITLG